MRYELSGELAAYVTAQRYNETPLRARCLGSGSWQAPVARASGLYRPEEEGAAESLVPWAPSLGETLSSTSSAAKILQSETGVDCQLYQGDVYFAVLAE
jgi:hypothetical protein